MNIAVKRRLLLTLNVVIVLLSAVSIFLPDRYRPHYRGTAILISWLVPIFLAAVCFYLGTRIRSGIPPRARLVCDGVGVLLFLILTAIHVPSLNQIHHMFLYLAGSRTDVGLLFCLQLCALVDDLATLQRLRSDPPEAPQAKSPDAPNRPGKNGQ